MYRPCQDWPQDIGTSSDKHQMRKTDSPSDALDSA